MQKRNILFLVDGFNQGGAEGQLYELIRSLNKSRYFVKVVTWYPSNFYKDLAYMEGVEWTQIIRKSRFDFRILKYIFSLIKSGGVDILHTYLDQAGFYGAVCKLFFPKLIFIATERSSFKNLSFIQRLHKPVAHKLADLTVANSYAGAEYLHSIGIDRNTIRVIHNGTNTSKFQTVGEPEFNGFQSRVPFPMHKKKILCVGRIAPVKNQLLIAQAFNNSRIKNDFILIFIGIHNVAYVDSIQRYISEEKLDRKVFILKESTEIEFYYRVSDLVVLFSDYEGTPNAVLEAMASGRTVVSSNVGDVKKYLDESFGWVLEKRDTTKLTTVFDEVHSMDTDQLRHRGKLAFEKFMSMGCDNVSMATKHEQVYEELINKKLGKRNAANC
jgi:glycosyltransferase involved in cell wall biosynthesis